MKKNHSSLHENFSLIRFLQHTGIHSKAVFIPKQYRIPIFEKLSSSALQRVRQLFFGKFNYSHYNLPIFIVPFLFVIFTFGSCKTSIKTVKIKERERNDSTAILDTSAQNIYRLLRQHEFKCDWLYAKASVQAEIDGKSNSFNITLKIKKDSVIWIYISPLLGLEAARVLVTKDSLKLMDRIDKKYQLADYKYLRDLLRIPVNYEILEAMLTGNFFAYRNENKFTSVYLEDKYFILSTLSKHKLKRSLEEKDPNKPISQDMWIDDVYFRVIRNRVEDNRINKTMEINYSDFRSTDYGIFPYKCVTDIAADKKIHIEIEYSKLTLGEPQDFPFTIPESYEKIR
jgi:hypothetical protein